MTPLEHINCHWKYAIKMELYDIKSWQPLAELEVYYNSNPNRIIFKNGQYLHCQNLDYNNSNDCINLKEFI